MLNHLNSNILRTSIIALRYLSLIFAEEIKLVIILSKGHKYEKETCHYPARKEGRVHYLVGRSGRLRLSTTHRVEGKK